MKYGNERVKITSVPHSDGEHRVATVTLSEFSLTWPHHSDAGTLFRHILSGHDWYDDGFGDQMVRKIISKHEDPDGIWYLVEWTSPVDSQLSWWVPETKDLQSRLAFLIRSTEFQSIITKGKTTISSHPLPILHDVPPTSGRSALPEQKCLSYIVTQGIQILLSRELAPDECRNIERTIMRSIPNTKDAERTDSPSNSMARVVIALEVFGIQLKLKKSFIKDGSGTPGCVQLVTFAPTIKSPVIHCILVDEHGLVFDTKLIYKRISDCKECVRHTWIMQTKKQRDR